MNYRVIVFLAFALLCACNGGGSVASALPGPASASVPEPGSVLYVYSPDGTPLLAKYPASARGPVSPSAVLKGSKTTFVGGKSNLFGGGISVAADGTRYVFDAMRAQVLTFKPAHGNVAPIAVETLPQNDGVSLQIPQYSGFALDTAGNFWTVDRSNGAIDRFRLGGSGSVKPSTTFMPSVREGKKYVSGVASTVASDGMGNLYCVCQPHELLLQLYCITKYDVTGSSPKLISSIYGILGNLDTQIPATVLHVDPNTKKVYVGIWKPAAVVEYPSDAKSGQAPAPQIIGGPLTTLASVPAAITTDSKGKVYVAQGDAIAVFAANASGNVKPDRIITDPNHLHFFGYAYGDLLAIH
ncbi:MAG TPA: hypothetical protein VKB39_00165 [Candidatus Baltobacteraceae bacterium]|nr:hypothetical protein [Candidatus Baltobacteraceae bacterium]